MSSKMPVSVFSCQWLRADFMALEDSTHDTNWTQTQKYKNVTHTHTETNTKTCEHDLGTGDKQTLRHDWLGR